jgi:hypothetical protein
MLVIFGYISIFLLIYQFLPKNNIYTLQKTDKNAIWPSFKAFFLPVTICFELSNEQLSSTKIKNPGY